MKEVTLKYIAVIGLINIAMSVNCALHTETISSFAPFLTKKISKSNVPSFSLSRISGLAKQYKTALSVILALILLDRFNWGAQKYRKWQKRPKKNLKELPMVVIPEEEPFEEKLGDEIFLQPQQQNPSIIDEGSYPPGVEEYGPAVRYNSMELGNLLNLRFLRCG